MWRGEGGGNQSHFGRVHFQRDVFDKLKTRSAFILYYVYHILFRLNLFAKIHLLFVSKLTVLGIRQTVEETFQPELPIIPALFGDVTQQNKFGHRGAG